MKKVLLSALLLTTTLMLAGCGRGTQVGPEAEAAAPEENRLGDKTEIDLAAWLKLSRPDLVKIGDEWTQTVEKQLEAARNNPESVDLLPKLLPPLAVPVLDKAKYDAAAGFSLPPYAEAGKKDAALALHLARHGDHEAALKLAPEDPAFRGQLAALKTETNYPVEWSRLVGLVMFSAQLKVTSGDVDGATDLVLLHRQLAALLEKKAADGPLGATLLSLGKRVLARSADAWREPKRGKTALADEITKALADWGPLPAPTPLIAFAAPSDQVQALFGSAPRGKAFIAETPVSVARVVELLGLPLSKEGVQVVVAFLDDKDRLAELQLAFRAKIDTLYDSPAQVAYRLLEGGYAANDESKSANLVQQTFSGAGLACVVVRSNRSPSIGGLVRLVPGKDGARPASTKSLRDFGPVSLDRGFEANRQALAPGQTGKLLLVKDGSAIKRMAAVLQTPVPEVVLLKRDDNKDVLEMLELAWAPVEQSHPLDKILPNLWDDYGPGKLEDVEDKSGSYLAFTWEDETTRVKLRLPYDDRGPMLSVQDTGGPDKARARLEEARRQDEKERAARLADGKPDVRLPRSPGQVNGYSLGGLQLGQTKAAVEAALPKGLQYRRMEVPGGVSVVILTAPEPGAPFWARQLLVRYDAGRVAEVRVRYQVGLAKAARGESLLERLTDTKAGAPESLLPTWTGLWADLSPPGKLVYLRWRDDRTVRTYQEDVGCAEVALLDRPADGTSPEAQPWRFVSLAVPGVKLGDTRGAVEAVLKAPVTNSNGAEVYRLPAASPYEMALVTYDGPRVVRVLAIHRERPGTEPKAVQAALSKWWGRNIDPLGFICRQEPARKRVLGAYYWHDDRVRVQTSVQTTDQGPRLMTEWRSWSEAKPQVTRAE